MLGWETTTKLQDRKLDWEVKIKKTSTVHCSQENCKNLFTKLLEVKADPKETLLYIAPFIIPQEVGCKRDKVIIIMLFFVSFLYYPVLGMCPIHQDFSYILMIKLSNCFCPCWIGFLYMLQLRF